MEVSSWGKYNTLYGKLSSAKSSGNIFPIVTIPLLYGSNPVINFKSVDLPTPLQPFIINNSLALHLKLTPDKIFLFPIL